MLKTKGGWVLSGVIVAALLLAGCGSPEVNRVKDAVPAPAPEPSSISVTLQPAEVTTPKAQSSTGDTKPAPVETSAPIVPSEKAAPGPESGPDQKSPRSVYCPKATTPALGEPSQVNEPLAKKLSAAAPTATPVPLTEAITPAIVACPL